LYQSPYAYTVSRMSGDSEAKGVVLGALGDAAGQVAGGVGAALGLNPVANVALTIFAGAIPAFIEVGYKRRVERRMTAANRAICRVAEEYDVDLSNLQDSEAASECFATMFANLMNSLDDAAAGPLGHLAMSYAREDKKPDRFFKGLGATLRDLDWQHIQVGRATH
jgi:hypothetical protein